MIAASPAHCKAINSGEWDHHFAALYEPADLEAQKHRYLKLLADFESILPGAETVLVNAPGRTELGGNHTDHNHGCILAAAVDLDCVAVVSPVNSLEVILYSEDYPDRIWVDLSDLTPKREEFGTAQALVRGVAAAFAKRGNHISGFTGKLHATCHPGAGLSSSAAFSLLVGAVFNFLFNEGNLLAQTLAVMAKEAENDFFGKPCGLMDQMASGLGQTIFVDFFDPEQPEVQVIEHSLEGTGYRLAVIDTGGSHVELTQEYAAIPEEMQAASQVLGKTYARAITKELFLENVKEIRRQAGDRATLRLLHFIEENERAGNMARSLGQGDFSSYLQLVEESGKSSCNLLQNCVSATSSREQGILVALALSERLCKEAICRVHGGGFAGTVQAYIPQKFFDNYRDSMENIFGTGSVLPVRIGRPGVCCLGKNGLALPGDKSV